MSAHDKLNELLRLGISDADKPDISQDFLHFTLRKKIIEHPRFTAAIREIARLHQRGQRSGIAEGMLLVAQTGSGKTTALEFYERRFPRIVVRETLKIPVLRVDTPESPTVKTLAEAILLAMGDPGAAKGTASEKTVRIIHYCKQCGVELLLIDEFQHFIDGNKPSESKRVTDWLKNLINKVCIPVILAGLPRAIAVVNSNPQLRRRFGAPFYMAPFGFDTSLEQREFRGVLKGIQLALPVPCVDLFEANLAQRFFYATHGLLDYVVKIVDDAVSRGGSGPSGQVTQPDLALAFKRSVWFDAPDMLNPFMEKATLRLLNRHLEPFDIWDEITQYTSPSGYRKKGKAGTSQTKALL
ncbi:MAG: hypothetical protein A3F78_11755 [Burkholderiales bacterium RIFCSPLOWO2_12_FULL_61_40]|nr:MAG: hypothetical protein A3F78_11755 [Burkholderiales bacterium RIFCSPLOWO2_12_FULL_61_40]